MNDRRERQYTLLNSNVMGRTPVLNTTTAAAVAGFAQLTAVPGSKVIASIGGESLDITWALALIIAAGLVWIARFTNDDPVSVYFETAGIALFFVACLAYGLALLAFEPAGLAGKGFVIALIYGAASNQFSRAVLLLRRVRVIHAGHRE